MQTFQILFAWAACGTLAVFLLLCLAWRLKAHPPSPRAMRGVPPAALVALLALATVRESLARARENLDVVSQQYRLGEASRIDFTDAVSDYVAELGGRITVFYRGQRAEAAIFPLMGISPEYREEKIREEK